MTARSEPEDAKRSPWRRLASRTPTTLSVIASLIAIGGLAFTVYKAAGGKGDPASSPSEAKQIVAFHQLGNRICVENREALEQALPEAHSRIQLLAYLSRGTGWGIGDLESVTAPAGLAEHFAQEIDLRRRIEGALLDIQRAGETGDLAARSEAIGAVDSAEEKATEMNHELGLRRCAPVLPNKVRKAIDVN